MLFPRMHLGPLYLIASLASSPAFASSFGFSSDLKAPVGCDYPPLIDATSDQLSFGLEKGCYSSVDLVNAYLGRIADVNSTLQVVTELNPDAVEIARNLDIERRDGRIRGPLHGLPILIKGNIGVADKMNTTVGSYALLGAKFPQDSTMVAKLREAGMIIIGMLNLSQWANYRSSNSTNGWSAYGGQVTAAYVEQQDPSGSSSGSGVASDLGLAFATLGTETSGSIVSPSDRNNIVGIKPTVGLTSRYLVVPISQRQDTIGPMTRTVKDAAKLLQVIAGPDPKDNYTSAIPFDTLPDYEAACQLSALKGKRIGIPTNALELFSINQRILEAFNTAISVLTEAGATIIENANFTALEEFNSSPSSVNVVKADFVSDIASFFSDLATNPNKIANLPELRDFTQSFSLEAFPDRDTARWDDALNLGFNNTSPKFWPIYQEAVRLAGEGGIIGALHRNKLDAVILPSSFAASVPAVVGSPIITVPMGAWPPGTEVEVGKRGLVNVAPGVPMGLSFLGDLWSEESLIGMAYAYEQRSLNRGKLKRYIQPKTELQDVL
ncbi:hypothetical protein AJ79_03455 [Helicocarpus griseus UAMH5409]|uniref:Amidase domain-containing protein n=1 Tax=Helicocarpus griseus UAMH5409 TaxID=1447875 RepID=A0A2B7XX25_9EURO|nr:hypothetical protein AJ79_03455 [Helicocarpus griseus UAMH5409]